MKIFYFIWNLVWREFLKHEKLTDNLIHFVLYSIAMVKPDTNTVEGIQQTRKFLSSLGNWILMLKLKE